MNFKNKMSGNIKYMPRDIKNFKNDGNKKRKLILTKLNIKLNVNGQFSVDDKRKVGLDKGSTNKSVYDKLRIKYNQKLDEDRAKQVIQKRTEKKVIKKTLKPALTKYMAKRKQDVFKQTTTITNPGINKVYEALKGKGDNFTIALVEGGNIIRLKNYFGDKGHNFMTTLRHDWQMESDHYWWDEFPNATLVIYKASQFTPGRVAQSFMQGITNCMFKPIIEHFESLRDKAKTDATYKKHNSKVNVATKMELLYREKGVNEKKDIYDIADKLGINININQPFQKRFIEARCGTKARNTFNFINTKLNHVDLNEITNESTEKLSYCLMQDMWERLQEQKIWNTYTRNNWGVSCIMTLDKKYILESAYQDWIKDFEEDTGLDCCYIIL